MITTTSFAKALWPGVNKWYGDVYKEFPVEWTQLFEKYTSKRNFEEDVGVSGLGLLSTKAEGISVTILNPTLDKDGSITRNFVSCIAKGLS